MLFSLFPTPFGQFHLHWCNRLVPELILSLLGCGDDVGCGGCQEYDGNDGVNDVGEDDKMDQGMDGRLVMFIHIYGVKVHILIFPVFRSFLASSSAHFSSSTWTGALSLMVDFTTFLSLGIFLGFLLAFGCVPIKAKPTKSTLEMNRQTIFRSIYL